MYAVVESGGKQYKVTVGQTVDVERMAVGAGRVGVVPIGEGDVSRQC